MLFVYFVISTRCRSVYCMQDWYDTGVSDMTGVMWTADYKPITGLWQYFSRMTITIIHDLWILCPLLMIETLLHSVYCARCQISTLSATISTHHHLCSASTL